MSDRLVEAALAWHDAGASVLPAGAGKFPARPWKDHQTERMSATELSDLLASGKYDGIGLVTGYGGFEMFELEGRAAHLLADLLAKLDAALVVKLMTYTERSPKGGFHFIYRVDPEDALDGSTKLARMPDEAAAAGWSVTIETRGRFGWTVLAPSGGNVHDEIPGGRWVVTGGVAGKVATLTEEEREVLFDAARSLDEMPPQEPIAHHARITTKGDLDLTPGQDFEQRADWLADILGPVGWTVQSREGDKTFLTRPGKKFGKSATLNYDGNDNLYVFTSSTDFPEMSSWTKFGAYAHLHHDDDFSAAAKELRRQGYGSQRDTSAAQAESRATLSLIQGGQAATTSGANALAPEASSSPVAYDFTDSGNAARFVVVESARLRFCPERRAWLAWESNRWAWLAGDGPAVWAMSQMIRAMPADDDAQFKHKIKSLSQPSLARAVRLAETNPDMQLHIGDLDAEPYQLNAPNGVIELHGGGLHESTPEGLHTRLTGVPIDFDADCPRFKQFLADTFGEDQEMIDFLQRLAGYSAIGKVTHHVLPFLHGSGANGKSVFMDVLLAVLGDYAAPAQSDLLLSSQIHESFVAMLQGVRLVVCNEVGPTAKFNEQRVKQFTGGDPITSRRLRQEPITFLPTHTLWVVGNHQPRVSAGGESFWRRLRLIGFTRTVPQERRIAGLADDLIREEGPAILAWIVRGAMAAKDGLNEPASVVEATIEYAEEEDHLGRFCEERIRFGGGDYVRMLSGDLYGAYESWCFSEGVELSQRLPNNVFSREMRSRGAGSARAGGRRFLTNVALMSSENVTEHPRPHQLDFLP